MLAQATQINLHFRHSSLDEPQKSHSSAGTASRGVSRLAGAVSMTRPGRKNGVVWQGGMKQ
jgi:hypothetical protein